MAAAHGGVLGVERVLAEGAHRVHVAHLGQVVVVPHGDLLHLVGGAEAVEEVDERHAALDGGEVRHGGQVHDLLHVRLGQHGEARLAACLLYTSEPPYQYKNQNPRNATYLNG